MNQEQNYLDISRKMKDITENNDTKLVIPLNFEPIFDDFKESTKEHFENKKNNLSKKENI